MDKGITMPNWCYNSTTVHGDLETLTRFVEAITVNGDKSTYDLTLLHPIPEELQIASVFFSRDGDDDPEYQELLKKYEANKAKYGHKDWYDWCIENWGTKWAPSPNDHPLEAESGVLLLSYDTAWSPPSRLLRKISELFPTLTITNSFHEEGMGFWGCEAFHGGKEVASYGMSDGEMPEEFKERRKPLEDKVISEDHDEWYAAHSELVDIGYEMKEFCEETVYRLLESAGLPPYK
jgi:hypothetical protein